jgi:hypothetical protein
MQPHTPAQLRQPHGVASATQPQHRETQHTANQMSAQAAQRMEQQKMQHEMGHPRWSGEGPPHTHTHTQGATGSSTGKHAHGANHCKHEQHRLEHYAHRSGSARAHAAIVSTGRTHTPVCSPSQHMHDRPRTITNKTTSHNIRLQTM